MLPPAAQKPRTSPTVYNVELVESSRPMPVRKSRLGLVRQSSLEAISVAWKRQSLGVVSATWKRHLYTPILYFGYVGLGVLFYVNVEEYESCGVNATSCPWSVLDAVYFAHVTMSTVGYGDLSPSTPGSQAFTLLYIFVGVIVVFSRLADLLTGVTQPVFNFTHELLERKFPQKAIDIDGDGVADFRIPRHPLIYYGKALVGPVTLILGLQCAFAAAFWAVEDGWSYWSAFYHCIVTATTVGYGDVSIASDGGKVVAILQILFSVASIAALINGVSQLHGQRASLLRRAELLSAKLNPELITTLDSDGDGVNKFEFVVGMLVKLEIVSWEQVQPFVTQFNELDTDASGHLDSADLAALAKQVEENARGAAGKIGASALSKISKASSKKRQEQANKDEASAEAHRSRLSVSSDAPPAKKSGSAVHHC